MNSILQDSNNNFWTITGATGLELDSKTSLRADYTYYRAENYDPNNVVFGMPYNDGTEEHIASCTLNRVLSETVSCSLRYSYYSYSDSTYGGQNDYNGHMVYASTKVKF